MPFSLRSPTVFSAMRAASEVARASYWGRCPYCQETTPWQVNALRGEYRCAGCGRSPLGDPADD